MIFSRGGRSGGRHAAADPRRSGRRSAAQRSHDDAVDGFDPGDERFEQGDPDSGGMPASASGPFDIADAPDGPERVDLGSLQIPTVDGVQVRVEANTEGVVQQIVLAHGESALQLGVFAAPRGEGIWDEVRAEIHKSLSGDGVAVEEAAGEYGRELRARVQTADGMMDVRFVGIDGPRWMLRAVYQGRAAFDPSAAGPLAECLRGLVVDRGREAMPAHDALPLRLPRDVTEAPRTPAAAE